MGYIKYTSNEFEKLEEDGQINIMALFGNGIDIQLMEYLDSPYRTSYENFYNYLCYKNFNKDNIIFKKMTEDKEKNDRCCGCKENWSDFENSLIEIFNEDSFNDGEQLINDFNQFQVEFSNFLNEIITPTMLAKLGNGSTSKELAINSFTQFLGDLNPENFNKLTFPRRTNHFKLFNWEILNFNYTSMLDNILVLDKEQYDPKPHKISDRQIWFYPNPKNTPKIYDENNACYDYAFSDKTHYSSYLMTNITHPHGYQNIPKSMLFGFDNLKQITSSDYDQETAKKFLKPYWAQNDKKYKHYFNDTRLFIIYGLSLGRTDFWWWNNILCSLLNTNAELIIYNYNDNNETDEDTINRFIEVASDKPINDEERKKLHGKIAVVQYNKETRLIAFKLDNK